MTNNIFFTFNESPGEEIKSAFSRTEHPRFSRGSSLKGRAVCLLFIPGHICGIVLKPLLYTSVTAFGLFATLFLTDDKKRTFVTTVKLAATAIVSPFGQIAKTVQAAAGVIHPGAYFKKASPSDGRNNIHGRDEDDIRGRDEDDIRGRDEDDIRGRDEDDIRGRDEDDISEGELEDSPAVYNYKRSESSAFNENIVRNQRNNRRMDFYCSHKNIEKSPERVIAEFAETIRTNRDCEGIRIHFSGERGVDAGGLSKAFFYELFQALSVKYNMQKELIPLENVEVSSTGIVTVTGSNAELLKDIGTVLAFLLIDVNMNVDGSRDRVNITPYPIGDAIIPIYFKGMLEFSYEELQAPFEELSVEALFAVYTSTLHLQKGSSESVNKEITGIVTDIANILNLPSNCDASSFREVITPLLKNIDTIYCTDFENAWSNATIEDKDDIVIQILEELLERKGMEKIKGLHAIAKGMNLSKEQWQNLQFFGYKHVQHHVAGHFNKQDLKNAITYQGLNLAFQRDFEAWIDEASIRDLKAFLSWATGNAAIPSNKLRLEGSFYTRAPAAHTCFNKVDVPENISARHFIDCALLGANSNNFGES